MLNKLLSFAVVPIILLPSSAAAFNMPVGGFWGGGVTLPMMIQNLITVLMGSAAAVCVAVFAAGAFFYIISAGDEQRKGLGKGMMVGAVIGAIIIAGAMGIMNTVLYFIYA